MLFAAVIVFSVGMFAFISGQDALRKAATTNVTSIALEKQAALEIWREERLTDIFMSARILGETSGIKSLISDSITPVVRIPSDPFIHALQNVRGQHFLSLLVMDSEIGMVVASTDVNEEGKFKESRPYFLNGKQRAYVQNLYYSFHFGGPAITFSAPIQSPEGELLGVLAGRANLLNITEVIARSSGLTWS